MINRRRLLKTTAAAAVSGFALSAPAVAQAKTKIRVAYLHSVATDRQIWTGMDRGSFDKQSIALELCQFDTGLEPFQAAEGLDMLKAGGAI